MKALFSKESLLALVVAAVVLWFVAVRTDEAGARTLTMPLGDAHQLVLVRSPAPGSTTATVEAFEFVDGAWERRLGPFPAHLGRNGWGADRREGDGTSPTGVYTLTEAFGSEPNPGTALPYRRIGPQDWWVSDPASPHYNTWQPGPPDGRWDPAQGELLSSPGYREAYRHSLVVDFNRSPVEAGRGSAIFLHVGSSPTSGCIAVAEEHVTALLRWLDPAMRPRIVMGWDELISGVRELPDLPVAAETGGIVPTTPRRIVDTRTGLGAPGPLGPRTEMSVTLGPELGVPADAVAVLVNLTVDRPTASTYLAAYPAGGQRPRTSNVNARAGEVRAALTGVRIGTGRQIRIYNDSGSSQVVADLVGYVAPSISTGYVPAAAQRLIDTRQSATPLGARQQVEVAALAPPGATAVVVNLTATGATRPTWIAAYAAGQPYPGTSTLNVIPGQDTANLAVVPLSADGRFQLLNDAGAVHVVADLAGFLVPGNGARYTTAAVPVRLVDSRRGFGIVGPIRPGTPRIVRLDGVPAGAQAVVLTVTGTEAAAPTWLKVTAPGSSTWVSTVNLQPGGVARANLAVVPVVDGRVEVSVGDASAQVVIDVTGWFLLPSPASSGTVTTVR